MLIKNNNQSMEKSRQLHFCLLVKLVAIEIVSRQQAISYQEALFKKNY